MAFKFPKNRTFVIILKNMLGKAQFKLFVTIICTFCISLSGMAQINFFDSNEKDLATKDFYKRSVKYTVNAIISTPNLETGLSFFSHQPIDRVSYYFDFKTNIIGSYDITGEEINGTGIIQKKVRYRSATTNIGIGHGFTRNLVIYASLGMVAQKTYDFKNTIASGYNFFVSKHGLYPNYGIGLLYVDNSKWSGQFGIDLYDRSISFGCGYTW